jgi:hypothetical protein
MKHLQVLKIGLFFILPLLLLFSARGQSVTSVQARINGSQLEIVYQMGSMRNGQKFNVELYTSLDNYAEKLAEGVTGDVGEDMPLVFENVMIIEDPIATLGFVTSDIQFKVIAHMIYNPVEVTVPLAPFKVKRGKVVEVFWRGGLAGENVSFNLYRNNSLILSDLYTVPNLQTAEVVIPKKQEKGEGYNLEMYLASINEPIQLPDFTVKAKKGWIALIVIGVLGYLAYDYTSDGAVTTALGLVDPEALPTPPGNPDDFTGFSFKFN